jgi:ATP-dependent RNA helicase DDX46/PRP5
MSGRDCIGIAKTGSGKTMAFVLPMIRHIKDQPPLANGDGPVALIMAPTRELVQQISKVGCSFNVHCIILWQACAAMACSG